MIYPYECKNCGHRFEVTKRIAEADNPEHCGKCSSLAKRYIAKRQSFYGAKVEDAEYCPATGQVVRNQKHRRQIARDMGLEEVGNDSGEYWKQRELDKEKETQKFYDDVGRDYLGELTSDPSR